MLKIIFFGTSDYCLAVLDSLYKKFQLTAIITKPPPNPVYEFAQKNKIRIFTPNNVAQLLDLESQLFQLKPGLAVVADYGLIIPEEIYNLPAYKTINIHFSHLPRFRGPSPVQFSILKGEKEAWVSVILMGKKVDDAPPLSQIKNTFFPNKFQIFYNEF